MIASLKELFNKGQKVAHESAVDYLAVDVSAANYVTDQPFRAVYVGTDGDLTLISPVTKKPTTFVGLAAGLYPFAGLGISTGTTTAGNLVVLF